jgi:uncharacterized RDD family membrane protein YckC
MPQRKPWDEEVDEDREKEFEEYGLSRDDYGISRFSKRPLAARGRRLKARIVDFVLTVGAIAPGGVLIILGSAMGDQRERFEWNAMKPDVLAGMALVVFGFVALQIYQIVLLSHRGQTIGKRMTNVRIVRMLDEGQSGFVQAWLPREFVPLLIGVVPFVGRFFGLADVLMIFRADRRCIHDMIASTKVVEA